MGKLSPWVARKRTPEDDAAAIEEFLNKGGKVVKLVDGADSQYDKRLKQTETRLGGGFNPFSKQDSLTQKD